MQGIKANVRNIYFDMYDHFELYFPSIANLAVDWYPSGRNEITIKLNDGTHWVYDDKDNTLRQLKSAEDFDDEEVYCKSFGRKLYNELRDKGMTSRTLSEQTGISTVTLSRYINGKALPNSYNLYKIARVLDCSPTYLLEVE